MSKWLKSSIAIIKKNNEVNNSLTVLINASFLAVDFKPGESSLYRRYINEVQKYINNQMYSIYASYEGIDNTYYMLNEVTLKNYNFIMDMYDLEQIGLENYNWPLIANYFDSVIICIAEVSYVNQIRLPILSFICALLELIPIPLFLQWYLAKLTLEVTFCKGFDSTVIDDIYNLKDGLELIKKGQKGFIIKEPMADLYSIKNFFLAEFADNAILFLSIILIAAFVVLAERRLMGAIQKREGPNVVGYGYLQPFADAFKLLFKEVIIPNGSRRIIFIVSPAWVLLISLISWKIIPISLDDSSAISSTYGLIYIYIFSSLNMLGLIFGGWASRSVYAVLGAVRSSAQIISYEVVIGIIFVQIAFVTGTLDLKALVYYQMLNGWLYQPLFFSIIFFFVAILAETNRTPFDLPESESELVAGYNVEYSSILFAFFMLSEYINIILISAVFILIFFGGPISPLYTIEMSLNEFVKFSFLDLRVVLEDLHLGIVLLLDTIIPVVKRTIENCAVLYFNLNYIILVLIGDSIQEIVNAFLSDMYERIVNILIEYDLMDTIIADIRTVVELGYMLILLDLDVANEYLIECLYEIKELLYQTDRGARIIYEVRYIVRDLLLVWELKFLILEHYARDKVDIYSEISCLLANRVEDIIQSIWGYIRPLLYKHLIVYSEFWFIFKTLIVVNLFILTRALLPRKRFDQLLELCWEILLLYCLITVFIFSIFIVNDKSNLSLNATQVI